MKRAVLLGRVSTKEQAEKGYSLPSQLEACREYAKQQGFEVVAEVSDDCSGAIPVADRPGGRRVYDMLRSGQADVVVQYTMDRVARDKREYPLEYLLFLDDIKKAGAELHFVDTGRSDGGILDLFKAWQASDERRKIAERTRRGRRTIAKTGQVMTHGKAPFGYRLTENGTRALVVYEPEAVWVRQIFEWYTIGDLSAYAIAKRLTGEKVLSWSDTHNEGRKKRERGEWHGSMVGRILKNEIYKGIWWYGKRNGKGQTMPRDTWIPVPVPSIVSEGIWQKAEAKRAKNKGWPNKTKRNYLVAGRGTCGCCGLPIHTLFYNGTNGKEYQYYVCSSYREKAKREKCDLPYFHVADVDKWIWDVISKKVFNPDYFRSRVGDIRAGWEQETRPLQARLSTVEDFITDHERQLNKILDLYLSDDFPKEILTQRKESLEKALDIFKAERDKLTTQLQRRPLTDEKLEEIIEDLHVLNVLSPKTFDAKKAWVNMLNVEFRAVVENGEKAVVLICELGEYTLPSFTMQLNAISRSALAV